MAASSLLASTLLTACASSGTQGHPPLLPDRRPEDAPAAFVPLRDDLRVAGTDTLAGPGCLNPMTDPRDGRRLTLLRSWATEGDYTAPAGSYGLGEREVLRLACNTGRVLGVVRR